jgi:hypothetical protein
MYNDPVWPRVEGKRVDINAPTAHVPTPPKVVLTAVRVLPGPQRASPPVPYIALMGAHAETGGDLHRPSGVVDYLATPSATKAAPCIDRRGPDQPHT